MRNKNQEPETRIDSDSTEFQDLYHDSLERISRHQNKEAAQALTEEEKTTRILMFTALSLCIIFTAIVAYLIIK